MKFAMNRMLPLLTIAALLPLAFASSAQARVDAEAIVGGRVNVGRVTLAAADVAGAIDPLQTRISERNGRAHYPAAAAGTLGKFLGQLLGTGNDLPPGNITVTFLFTGDEPLDLIVYTPAPVQVTIDPRAGNPRQYDRLLERWWKDYQAQAKAAGDRSDHPPMVYDYLTTMLASRYGLPLAPPSREDQAATPGQKSLELLFAMERLKSEAMKNTMLGRSDFGEPADIVMPEAIASAPLPVPPLPADLKLEPMASHVPEECFYVRFGKFSNYLWLNKLLADYGGDISSMATLRSYVQPLGERVQKQLSLEQNELAELFGDTVISDVALIGRDTYMNDGAAIGILFEARDSELLTDDFTGQRKRRLAEEKEAGCTLVTLKIAGRDVSLLSTPDNRIRSFYAIDGNYHLVTTSRAIVERFFAAGSGNRSLAAAEEFRYARMQMPLTRNDTIFVYFSTRFFEELLGPQYQIELYRRLQSVTDMNLLQLARLAAVGEGLPSDDIDDLIAAGLLPRGFGRRPDGSGPIVTPTGSIDSLRGPRGYFAPVPDVTIRSITATEADRVNAFTRSYAAQWKRMDPLMIGIQRTALDTEEPNGGSRERIVVDANIALIDETKYGSMLSMLGPATNEMITPAAGDVITMQASVRGGLLLPTVPPHYLFLGVQDMVPMGDVRPPQGLLQTVQFLKTVPGYIGGWPKPGFLDALPFNLGGSRPDAYGFSQLPFGLWRRQGGGFSVLSFDPNLLAEVTPQLRPVESETAAQIRLHVGDLSGAKVSSWVNRMYEQRAIEASQGNVHMMNLLHQQLGVPLEDSLITTEQLLDANLKCPLGGKYELAAAPSGEKYWQSSAWNPDVEKREKQPYQAPLLTWFRGVDAHLIRDESGMSTHLELDMIRKASDKPKAKLPSFMDLFGGGQKAVKPKKNSAAEELPPPLPPVPKGSTPQFEAPTIEIPGFELPGSDVPPPAPTPAPGKKDF